MPSLRRRFTESDEEQKQASALVSFICEVSNQFIRLPPEKIPGYVKYTLERVALLMGFDAATFSVLLHGGPVGQVKFIWQAQGTPVISNDLTERELPWVAQQIARKRTVQFQTRQELPPEADVDRQTLERLGIKSCYAVPLFIESRIVGSFGVSAIIEERPAPLNLFTRLQMVGEVIANALERMEQDQTIHQMLEFERFLTDLSARFLNLKSGQIDTAIQDALKSLCLFLGLDRCSIGRFTEDESRLEISHSYYREGVMPPPAVIERHQLPNYFRKLISGEPFILRQSTDAAEERAYCEHYKVQSMLAIPVLESGNRRSVCTLLSTKHGREWKDHMVERVGIAAHLLINSLAYWRMEETLDGIQRDLERATRINTMSELSSALAHELNQPLAAILSNAQAAKRFMGKAEWDSGEIQTIIDDIIRDDKRASNVIHQLRGMVAKTEYPIEQNSINQIIKEVTLLLRSDLIEHNIQMEYDLHSRLPGIAGSRVEIQQVLVNLMVNAIDALKEVGSSSRKIIIRTALDGNRIVVTVSDNGPGIPADRMETLFQLFNTSKSKGLGLAICNRIVERHGGHLWLDDSKGNQGATFCFSLPALDLRKESS